MTHCTCHPGSTCASAASCAAARKTEFGEAVSTEQKLREALEELLYAHTDKAVAMARAALSLPATEQASAEQEPVGESAYEKVQAEIVARYVVEKRDGGGFWPYCVRAIGGRQEIYVGHKTSCEDVRQALQTACLDGAFMASNAAALAAPVSQPAPAPLPELSEPRPASAEDMAVYDGIAQGYFESTQSPLPELSDEVFDVLSMARMVLFQYHKLYRLDSEQRLIDRIDAAIAAKKGGV